VSVSNPWSEATDEELANAANSGLAGQGAVVEITRRLMVAIQNLDRATTKLSKWLIAFTIALVVLTGVLVLLTVALVFGAN
jgi:hypothetical protein